MPDKHFVTVRAGVWKENALFLQKEWSEVWGSYVWDMPGGRIDIGESIIEGLKREVKEEIGVNLKSISKLPSKVYSVREQSHGIIGMIFSAEFASENFRFDTSDTQEVHDVRYISREEFKQTPDFVHKTFILEYFDEYLIQK
jgi:8-oxo-dGTP pyrophosphatase MutT (NUDIX family)